MSSSRLYFDASNVISWGPQPAVGIPRVETALVREALQSGHHIFLYDRSTRNPRLLSDVELQHLQRLLSEVTAPAWTGSCTPTKRERINQVRRLADLAQGQAGPEFERYLAGILAGDWRRQGLTYQSLKFLVRSVLRFDSRSRQLPSATKTSGTFLDDPTSRVLFSSRTTHDLTYDHRRFNAQIYAMLYDLIPLQGEPFFPERNAARFLDEAEWITRNCRRVVCPSNFTRTQAAQRFPQAADKFHTVYPAGLLFEATQKLDANRPQLPTGFPEAFAIYCATIEPRKNHAMLANVWIRLHDKLGSACPALYLVGRWGWRCAEAEASIRTAQEHGAPVSLLSNLSDRELIWLYGNATIGVYPSMAEGFGLGVAESLDFGLPILISDAPALFEAAQGLMPVLPATDPVSWLSAIEKILSDPNELSALRASIAKSYIRRSAREFFDNAVRSMRDGRTEGNNTSDWPREFEPR